MSKYIAPEEMLSIIDLCHAMDNLWKTQEEVNRRPDSVNIDVEELFAPFGVYDINGEMLGRIAMGDGGNFVLYVGEEE